MTGLAGSFGGRPSPRGHGCYGGYGTIGGGQAWGWGLGGDLAASNALEGVRLVTPADADRSWKVWNGGYAPSALEPSRPSHPN
jgi:hypothetical protein